VECNQGCRIAPGFAGHHRIGERHEQAIAYGSGGWEFIWGRWVGQGQQIVTDEIPTRLRRKCRTNTDKGIRILDDTRISQSDSVPRRPHRLRSSRGDDGGGRTAVRKVSRSCASGCEGFSRAGTETDGHRWPCTIPLHTDTRRRRRATCTHASVLVPANFFFTRAPVAQALAARARNLFRLASPCLRPRFRSRYKRLSHNLACIVIGNGGEGRVSVWPGAAVGVAG
jgi:hypothetical protein